MNAAIRILSLVLLLAAWYAGSQIAGERLLPYPPTVALAIVEEARSGALAFNLAVTLARVAAAFIIAMALGSAIGIAMGRYRLADRFGDPWLVVLLNLPALVIIVLIPPFSREAAIELVQITQNRQEGGGMGFLHEPRRGL